MNKKRLLINLLANVVSFIVSFGISFFLTPYITEALGTEAYGFISLGNNFVSYVMIITSALNAMAARFITVAIYEDNDKQATEYFSSVLAANIIISLALVIPASILIVCLESVIQITPFLVLDVKLLWAFLFTSFVVTLISSVYSVAPYAKNRMDLAAYRDIIYNFVRAILLFLAFYLFSPHVWYYGLVAIISSIVLTIINIFLHKNLLPSMKFSKKNFSQKAIFTLIKSGIWSSVGSLSTTLLEGLDLLVANIFINATAMGVLSIAKTLPLAINSMVSTVQQVFVPGFTISYAKKEKTLIKDINSSIKLMSMFSSMPLVALFVLGKDFFKLWVPYEDARVLHIISLLTVGTLIVTAAVKPLYAIYTVTNKLKANSLTTLLQGVMSTGIVFLLLAILPKEVVNNATDPWGLYIIAGISSLLGIIRALTFTPMYAAYCLGEKLYVFYPAIFKSLLNTALTGGISFIVTQMINVDSWLVLIITGCIVCIIVLMGGWFVVLNKGERHTLKKRIISKVDKIHKSA